MLVVGTHHFLGAVYYTLSGNFCQDLNVQAFNFSQKCDSAFLFVLLIYQVFTIAAEINDIGEGCRGMTDALCNNFLHLAKLRKALRASLNIHK